MLNVSGHRIGTAEVEGAIGKTKGVAEAAVVGFEHEIKGQGIYAYVTLMTGLNPDKELNIKIKDSVTKEIGLTPNQTRFNIRRITKNKIWKDNAQDFEKIAENDLKELGDISTLADPAVVKSLVKERIS